MRAAALFTGGKDSTYTVRLAQERGIEVVYLLTMVSERPDSWMFHTVNIQLAERVAAAIGIEHIIASTKGEREEELEDLERALEQLEIDGVVTGAISSTYQKNRVDRICGQLGLRHVSPLWGRNGRDLFGEMISAGLVIMVTAVAARGLDEGWLGKILDSSAVDELAELNSRFGVDVCGDGGEMETLVLDAPWFKSRIEVIKGRKIWEGTNGCYSIEEAKLVSKKS